MVKTIPSWQYSNPVQIVFGQGALSHLPKVIGGRKALLVTTAGFSRRGCTERLRTLLRSQLDQVYDRVQPNPDISVLELYLEQAPALAPEVILAVGGGSVIDTAKVFSLAPVAHGRKFSLRSHFESAQPIPAGDPIPIVAIPTTAGTGSEVTPFATIWDKAQGRKHSLASNRLFPRTAILDPELTLSLPRETTIAAALDALSHAFESVWNRNATCLTTPMSTQAISIILDVLPRLVDHPAELSCRGALLEASLLAGLAVSNTRTALAHSISYPITIRLGVPHGLACGFTLPALLEFNAEGDDGRLEGLARRLGCENCIALGKALRQLFERIGLDALMSQYRLRVSHLISLKSEMFTPGRAGNNLRAASLDDVEGIVTRAAAMYPNAFLGPETRR